MLILTALRRSAARRVCAVIPYFAYCRQTQKLRGREPISGADVSALFEDVGVDHVVTVDIFREQTAGFFSPLCCFDVCPCPPAAPPGTHHHTSTTATLIPQFLAKLSPWRDSSRRNVCNVCNVCNGERLCRLATEMRAAHRGRASRTCRSRRGSSGNRACATPSWSRHMARRCPK